MAHVVPLPRDSGRGLWTVRRVIYPMIQFTSAKKRMAAQRKVQRLAVKMNLITYSNLILCVEGNTAFGKVRSLGKVGKVSNGNCISSMAET